MKKGDQYSCSDSNCGCEIEVTQSSHAAEKQSPRCSCGHELRKSAGVKAA
ncbi:MAG: hypothetical protein ACRD1L_06265 [Terriglobales bacterium]